MALEEKNRCCNPAACGRSEFRANTRGRKGGERQRAAPPAPGRQWVQRDEPCGGAEGDDPATGDGANKRLAMNLHYAACLLIHFYELGIILSLPDFQTLCSKGPWPNSPVSQMNVCTGPDLILQPAAPRPHRAALGRLRRSGICPGHRCQQPGAISAHRSQASLPRVQPRQVPF